MKNRYWIRFRRNMQGMVSGSALILIILLATVGSQVTPMDPLQQNLTERLRPPMSRGADGTVRIFGTDQLGRDVLSRVIAGARVSVIVGVSAVLIAGIAGSLLGMLAGYFGGAAEAVIMRIADVQLAFPFILLAISWAAFLGTGLVSMVVIVAISGWVDYARVVRGLTLTLKQLDFVQAYKALGGTDGRAIFRHILPNVLPTILVIATLQMGRAVLLEATLSFLGLGIQPPTPAWGSMLSEGRNYLDISWWITVFPGLGITVLVLSSNLFGDAMRDVFDPRLNMTNSSSM